MWSKSDPIIFDKVYKLCYVALILPRGSLAMKHIKRQAPYCYFATPYCTVPHSRETAQPAHASDFTTPRPPPNVPR